MQSIATEIEIAAPAARVWAILTDFAAYPTWNPFIQKISGPQTPGETLTVAIQPVGGRAMTLRPRVLAFEEFAELRWKGHVLFPGVFAGEHCFQLSQSGEHRTLFKQSETFTGLLVSLVLRGAARRGTEQGFIAMNEALKHRAESAGG